MERNYTTQMDAARRGIITPELEIVARKEQMRPEELMPLVAEGKVAIPANRLHTCLDAQGIGSMLRTKTVSYTHLLRQHHHAALADVRNFHRRVPAPVRLCGSGRV